MPTPQLSELSGSRSWFPPVTTGNWAFSCTYELLAGTPSAMQLVRMFAGDAAVRPEQGSTTSWSKREGVPNNSPMLGARKPSAQEPRKRRSSIGCQLIPALSVVVDPEVE